MICFDISHTFTASSTEQASASLRQKIPVTSTLLNMLRGIFAYCQLISQKNISFQLSGNFYCQLTLRTEL